MEYLSCIGLFNIITVSEVCVAIFKVLDLIDYARSTESAATSGNSGCFAGSSEATDRRVF